MVGFVHNHPDRPFVMCGMFHGGVVLGGRAQNYMRSIQTKSGIKVLMNDNEKSVKILDPREYLFNGWCGKHICDCAEEYDFYCREKHEY